MWKKQIEVESNDRVFPHGEIREVKNDYSESSLEVEIQLVVSSDDRELFHKELEELISKFAI